MKLSHITLGKAGLHVEDSRTLAQAIQAVQTAGFAVEDVEDDPEEALHVATILYPPTGNHVAAIRRIKDALGLPYPGKKP